MDGEMFYVTLTAPGKAIWENTLALYREKLEGKPGDWFSYMLYCESVSMIMELMPKTRQYENSKNYNAERLLKIWLAKQATLGKELGIIKKPRSVYAVDPSDPNTPDRSALATKYMSKKK